MLNAKWLLAGALSSTFSVSAQAQFQTMSCDYQFMGAPVVSIELGLDAANFPDSSAKIIRAGQAHFETVSYEKPAANELVHVWISRDVPQGSVEMIVFKEVQREGRSKLFNPHVPMGNTMWGDCRF